MEEMQMLTRNDLAQRWRVSKSFLDKQMVLAPETLPPFVKIGRQTRFPLHEVMRWESKQLQHLNQ